MRDTGYHFSKQLKQKFSQGGEKKVMKKSLSVILAAALAFGSFGSLASAADLTAQQKFDALAAKGIFVGINGEAALDQDMTRAQFARVAALLTGAEGIGNPDTKVVTVKPFPDVALGVWYTEEIAAVKESGAMKGNANGTFAPNGKITVQETAVVLANVLGLAPVADATVEGAAPWAAGYIKAVETAGIVLPTNYTENATRALLVSGAFAIDAALSKPATLSIESVKATAANELTVKLNRDLADAEAPIFAVKFGLLPQDVTAKVSDDKKSITLTSETNFIAGDYTVEVSGVEVAVKSFAVKIEAQKLESFTITTTNLTAVATQDIVYQPVDQYGKNYDLAASNFTASATNVTDGTAVAVNGNGNKFTTGTSLVGEVDSNVVVTIIHNTTGKSQTKTFKVATAAFIDSVSFEQPAPKADTARITTGDATDVLVLPITLLDQYGQKVTATTANLITALTKEITFVSSNTTIVDPALFAVNGDGKLTYRTGATAGNVTISAITKGGKSSSITFQVHAPAALASVSIQTPTGLVVAGEGTKVTYTAVDTFGAAAKLAALTDVVWFSTNPTAVDVTTDIAVNAKGEITITPGAAGAATISVFLNGAKQSEITLDVKAAAVATKISKIADSSITLFNKNAGTHTYAAADIEVVDQYNRVIATANLGGAVTVAVKDATTNAFTAAGAMLTAADDQVASKTIVLTYTAGAIVLTKEFSASVVEASAVVGYAINDVANTKLHAGGYASAAAAGDHAVTFAISNGLTADSKKVGLSAADKAAFTVTTSDSSAVAVDGSSVHAVAAVNNGASVVTVWKNGVKVKEVSFTTSSATPAVSELKFDGESVTIAKSTAASAAASAKLTTVKDQYGATIALGGVTWFSADATIATVDAATGAVTTTAKGGTVKITVVAPNGTNASINVVSE
ncbi:S-layer homology domain-containing protein [Cohnella sp.]|uniref:S-layer homology domain-containing protein n=1 Tax=Cohnella sp. TaxID=1883426 RepID=UPI003563C3EE